MADIVMLKTGWDFGKDFFKVFYRSSDWSERMDGASDQVTHLKRGYLCVKIDPKSGGDFTSNSGCHLEEKSRKQWSFFTKRLFLVIANFFIYYIESRAIV